jgi:hypothetical protein
MKHLSEEDLIGLYCGEAEESGESAAHLRACRECTASFTELQKDLAAMRPVPVPQRGAQYGEEAWQRLRPTLVAYERQPRGWEVFRIHWKAVSLAATCALLMAAAFVGGRVWERHRASITAAGNTANPQAAQRVVLVVLTDHLDRTERLLVALEHADPGDHAENVQLQSQARELLASNRLYRVSASEDGDPAVAAALDRLERVLAEVANDSTLTAADLERVRNEMNTEGILFEIRVLLSKTPDQTNGAEHAKGAII